MSNEEKQLKHIITRIMYPCEEQGCIFEPNRYACTCGWLADEALVDTNKAIAEHMAKNQFNAGK